ncbi:MAG: MarR family transcriptional regulator [Rhizobiales bacterium NRL2]|jgi:DNA-binding MarR family transcriptional regulator|nr:MAG: MarR family transcriptional regulator [Rhizobiales bacterium NRL2]
MNNASRHRTDDSLIALHRIVRATELYSRDLAQAAGLTPTQLRVLQIVDSQDSATPKALAQQMRVSQATVTSLVDKLVAHGMVRRLPSQADRRQTHIVSTPIGHERLQQAAGALPQRFVRAFQALADWEQAQLIASLERVAAMLDAVEIEEAPLPANGEIHRESA